MTETDLIKKCACIISGNPEPPLEFVDAVKNVAGGVNLSRRAEKENETRSALREKMADIRDAAELIIAALHQSDTLQWLTAPVSNIDDSKTSSSRQLSSLEEERITVQCLQRLRDQASNVINLAKKGKGRNRIFVNPEGMSAKQLCALSCAILWRETRRSEIKSSNHTAWEACDALWLASGGDITHENSRTDPSGWRDELKHVKKINDRSGPKYLSTIVGQLRGEN